MAEKAGTPRDMARCEVTTDSGAEESVWPWGWLREPQGSGEPKKFEAANGQELGHCGTKVAKFRRQGCAGLRDAQSEHSTDPGR